MCKESEYRPAYILKRPSSSLAHRDSFRTLPLHTPLLLHLVSPFNPALPGFSCCMTQCRLPIGALSACGLYLLCWSCRGKSPWICMSKSGLLCVSYFPCTLSHLPVSHATGHLFPPLLSMSCIPSPTASGSGDSSSPFGFSSHDAVHLFHCHLPKYSLFSPSLQWKLSVQGWARLAKLR